MKKIILCFLFMVCAFSSSIKGVFAESMSNVEPLDNESGLIEQSVMGYKALAKKDNLSLFDELEKMGIMKNGYFDVEIDDSNKSYLEALNDEIMKEHHHSALAQNTIRMPLRRASRKNKGKWIYQYTIDPFSFYKNSATGKWRTVQTTSTITHTAHTVVEGNVTHSTSWPVPYYNPAYKHLLGA